MATEDEFQGPLKKRQCTDVFCLILFLAYIGGLVFLSSYASQNRGDPRKFFYGVDSWGNTCNQPNENLTEFLPNSFKYIELTGVNTKYRKKLFYFNAKALIPEDLRLALTGPKGFVENFFTSVEVCVKSCPEGSIITATDLQNAASSGNFLCRYDVELSNYLTAANDTDKCPKLPVGEHESLLNRCVPNNLIATIKQLAKYATSAVESTLDQMVSPLCKQSTDLLTNVWNDIHNTWKETLYICAISLGCSIVIALLLRFLAGITIWTLVVFTALAMIGTTASCWYLYFLSKDRENLQTNGLNSTLITADPLLPAVTFLSKNPHLLAVSTSNWFIIAMVTSVVSVIGLLILLVLRKRIALLVQLFKEAGKCLSKMPVIFIQPLWTLIMICGFVAGLFLACLYLQTAGTPIIEEKTGFVKFTRLPIFLYTRWMYVFGALWTVELCYACQQVVIAGAVAQWYFSIDKSKIGWPILAATKRLLIYHLGSVAFGSLIIAVIQMARIVIGYIQRKLSGKSNKIIIFILKGLVCVLWCFEKFMKFVNKNAYIIMAIYGDNFCKSARRGFSIIVNNALRMAVINSAGTFCLLLAQLAVVAISCLIGYQFFLKVNPELCYVFAPLFLAGALSFLVSHCILSIYGMIIDAIFICFCEDCDKNDGLTKPFYMSKGLMSYVSEAAGRRLREDVQPDTPAASSPKVRRAAKYVKGSPPPKGSTRSKSTKKSPHAAAS